jgi:hypothetical protein
LCFGLKTPTRIRPSYHGHAAIVPHFHPFGCQPDIALLLQKKANAVGNAAVFEQAEEFPMSQPSPITWRHVEPAIIVLCVRWELRYALSSRDLEEIAAERGLQIDGSVAKMIQRGEKLPKWPLGPLRAHPAPRLMPLAERGQKLSVC